MNATKMTFERRYGDDSGVEFAVRYDATRAEVEFEHVGKVSFPVDEIEWLVDALYRVKRELPEKPKHPDSTGEEK